METNSTTLTSLVIREHDFQQAKNSLKQYVTKSDSELSLPSVPSSGGLFNLGDHKVTGDELNNVTTQIQDYFIHINKLVQGLVSEFGQVYNAFESLDKDYITGIVGSIKSAEEVSKKEKKDRADIQNIIKRLEESVDVLKKFKEDINKLKHITDVDKTWELILNQEEKTELLQADVGKALELISNLEDLTNSLQTYKESLTALSHLLDADVVWDDVASLKTQYIGIENSVSNISVLIGEINGTLAEIQNALAGQQTRQQEFEKKIENEISEFCSSTDQKFLEQSDEIHNALEITKAELSEQFSILFEHQEKQNLADRKAQEDELVRFSQEQKSAIDAVKKAHDESMDSFEKTLESESSALQETVGIMKQKLKTAYIIAGSAATLTLIHLVLNVIGVI